MNKRQFLKGMVATAAGILVPGHVLSGQYQFHQRVQGLRQKDTPLIPDTGHGPQELAFGNEQLGYFGRVLASEFITPSALRNATGVTQGSVINDDSGWLKYAYNGKICFVAQKNILSSVSWQHIYQRGCVYGTSGSGVNPSGDPVLQDRTVVIDGYTYRVRLMKGLNQDPSNKSDSSWDLPQTHGSEWNKIMYRLHDGIHTDNRNSTASEGDFERWDNLSDTDLNVQGIAYSWCQETPINTNRRVLRGWMGVSRSGRGLTDDRLSRHCWRPVLEKI